MFTLTTVTNVTIVNTVSIATTVIIMTFNCQLSWNFVNESLIHKGPTTIRTTSWLLDLISSAIRLLGTTLEEIDVYDVE